MMRERVQVPQTNFYKYYCEANLVFIYINVWKKLGKFHDYTVINWNNLDSLVCNIITKYLLRETSRASVGSCFFFLIQGQSQWVKYVYHANWISITRTLKISIYW